MSPRALCREIQDFLDVQVQRGQQGSLESLVPQEAEAYVALEATLVLQDAEVWLVQHAVYSVGEHLDMKF